MRSFLAKKPVLIAIGILISFLSAGCDKVCKKTVEDVATIQNMTGRQLSLYVCKGRSYGEALVTIASDTNQNEVSLGLREATVVRGVSFNCSEVSGEKTSLGIALSPKSYGQVKFCFDDVNFKNLIVENYQTCPVGFLEQTSADPCK